MSLNLYTYCHNKPIWFIDPSGQDVEAIKYRLESAYNDYSIATYYNHKAINWNSVGYSYKEGQLIVLTAFEGPLGFISGSVSFVDPCPSDIGDVCSIISSKYETAVEKINNSDYKYLYVNSYYRTSVINYLNSVKKSNIEDAYEAVDEKVRLNDIINSPDTSDSIIEILKERLIYLDKKIDEYIKSIEFCTKIINMNENYDETTYQMKQWLKD